MKMASKWPLLVLSGLLLHSQLCDTFVIPQDPECHNHDNETYAFKEKCLWLLKFQRNLGKYRNFYANLLQEDNKNFAVELQELYNIISNAIDEPDINERLRMIFYSIWLVESTKHLEDFLIDKGVKSIA